MDTTEVTQPIDWDETTDPPLAKGKWPATWDHKAWGQPR